MILDFQEFCAVRGHNEPRGRTSRSVSGAVAVEYGLRGIGRFVSRLNSCPVVRF